MTTPRVTELPRRLEPSGADTFLGGSASKPVPPASRDARPLAAVVQLRPSDPLASRRLARARRGPRPRRPGAPTGPGGDQAA